MDPVTIGAVLLAVAGGVGGGLGSSLWTGVGALVRRPFRRHQEASGGSASSSGEQELAAFERAPADEQRAQALARVLVTRSEADPEFRQVLQAWWDRAAPIRDVVVVNTISGGAQYGPVLQGQNFSGLTFGPSAVPPPSATPPADQNS